jgi:hypothetical protein
MSNVTLGLKIVETRREISALEATIEADVRFFTENKMYYYSRESATKSGHERRYDEMVYSERKLGLAQQRLASLLLELTTESIDRLDSSVKTLDSNVKTLDSSVKTVDSSVGSLSNLTRRLVKSSKTLEYLTSLIILVAIVPISLSFLSFNPYYSLVISIAAFVGFVVIARRARRELPKILGPSEKS